MTKPITLGEIRVFDDGDGVIDPAKDKITGLHDEKPIPVDSFSSDPRIQSLLENLGINSLEGVPLEKASHFFSQTTGRNPTERASLRAEIYDQIHKAVGIKAAERAERREQEWLEKNGPALKRQKEAAIRAADIAKARQEAYDKRFGRDTDATQEILGTDFKMDGAIEDEFDGYSPEQRHRIFETMAWIQPTPDKKMVNRILTEVLKRDHYLNPQELETIIAKAITNK